MAYRTMKYPFTFWTSIVLPRFALLCVSATLYLALSVGAESMQGLHVPGARLAGKLYALRVQWFDPRPFDRDSLSKAAVDDIVAPADGVKAYFGVASTTVKVSSDSWVEEKVGLGAVTGDMFATLGVEAALGRLDIAERRVVISHRLWEQAFARAPDVIGQRLVLFGRSMAKDPRTIVEIAGVAAEGFRGLQPSAATQDIWLAWDGWRDVLLPGLSDVDDAYAAESIQMDTVLRLRSGKEPASVAEELTARAITTGRIVQSDGKLIVETGLAVGHVQRARYQQQSGIYRLISTLLLVISGMSLFAMQTLQHTGTRHADLIRSALGEPQLARLLRESREAVVAVTAPVVIAAGIVMFGAYRLPDFGAFIPPFVGDSPALARKVLDDATLLWLAALVIVLMVKPTMRALLPNTRSLHVRGARRRVLALPVLVVAFALMTIIASAVASVMTIEKLRTRDFGFQANRLSMIRVEPVSASNGTVEGYFWRQMSTRPIDSLISRLSEVLSRRFALASASPFDAPLVRQMRFDGDSEGASPRYVFVNEVSSDYFRVLGVPLVGGSGFSGSAATDEVLVSEKYAARFLGEDRPLGRKFELQRQIASDKFDTVTVVGVVPDFHRMSPKGELLSMIYRPLRQEGGFWLALSSHEDAAILSTLIREHLAATASGQWMAARPTPISGFVDQSYRPEQSAAFMLTAVAFGLAALGVIGLMSLLRAFASARAAEFAMRRVLGAKPRQLATLIIGVAPWIAVPSGLVAAFATHRWIQHVLPASDGGVSMMATVIAASCVFGCWSFAAWLSVSNRFEGRLLDALNSESF